MKKFTYSAVILALLSSSVIVTSCSTDDPTELWKPEVTPPTPNKPEPVPEPEPEPEKAAIDMTWLDTYNPSWWQSKASSLSITASDVREADPSKPEEMFVAQTANTSGWIYAGAPMYLDTAIMFPLVDNDSDRKAGDVSFLILNSSRQIIGNTYAESYNPSDGFSQEKMIYADLGLSAGNYYAVPVYRPQGESKWILPSMAGLSAFDNFEGLSALKASVWGFEVKAVPQDRLTLYYLIDPEIASWLSDPTGEAYGRDGHYMFANTGEKFTSKYIICNPSGKAMSGTLVYRDIRKFALGFVDPVAARNLDATGLKATEWDREIGSSHIDIPAGTKVFEGTIDGTLSQSNYPSGERYVGGQYLFFKPDGSSEEYMVSLDERRIMSAYQGVPSTQWDTYAQSKILMNSHTNVWTNQKFSDAK